MSVRRSTSGNVTVLKLGGEFYGGDETDRLRQAIHDELESGNQWLLLDLSECSNMNSGGLLVIVEAHQLYSARQGEVKLCGLQKKMTSLLAMTRLIDVFGHYATEAEALSAFALSSSGA